MSSHILLATHGGESAAGAARVAVQLAQRLHAPIDVIAVLAPPPVLDAGYGPVFVLDETMEREAREQLRADADAQLQSCGWTNTTGSTCIEGPPTQMILEETRARHADLIVVGLGPHHFVDRALGGETALRLAQVADVPVLAVPAGAAEVPHRVVAAIDFSPTSIEAARLAASWLTAGDVLLLAHVAPPTSRRAARDDAGARSAAESAPHRLPDVAKELPVPSGVTVTPVELSGDPARALLDFAEREHADLIALGSHGYGMWKRFMLGSVASKVLRLATCSVLVVRPTGVQAGVAAASESRIAEQTANTGAR
ncbi:MAG TPA: universal stress protein [Gemmatimonadaceae bacterium]